MKAKQKTFPSHTLALYESDITTNKKGMLLSTPEPQVISTPSNLQMRKLRPGQEDHPKGTQQVGD